MSKLKYFIYTDASYSHAESIGVSGFLIFENQTNHEENKISELGIRTHFFKESNNIRAEILGAILALNFFSEDFKTKKTSSQSVEINLYSDCQTLTKLLSRRHKLEATDYISARKKTQLANTDLYKTFFLIYDELKPNIYWVKGHSKKENQSFVQKNFQMIDQQVRKVLRALLKK